MQKGHFPVQPLFLFTQYALGFNCETLDPTMIKATHHLETTCVSSDKNDWVAVKELG